MNYLKLIFISMNYLKLIFISMNYLKCVFILFYYLGYVTVYVGEFANGFEHGQGKQRYPNGSYFEGTLYLLFSACIFRAPEVSSYTYLCIHMFIDPIQVLPYLTHTVRLYRRKVSLWEKGWSRSVEAS